MSKSCNTKVCCIKCNREISRINFDRHYETCKKPNDPIPDDLRCGHCGKQCKNKLSFRSHERTCPSNPDKNHKFTIKGKTAWNKGKTKETNEIIKKSAKTRKSRYKSGELKGSFNGRKHSEETKRKMSEKRKKYLEENPDKHPWKSKNKFISEPCEKVKQFLSNQGIKFVPEWSPSSDRHYSIDIAFPDIKMGIEINGNQHYDKKGNLLPYYQERHNHIINLGWILLELHYSIAWDLDQLLDIISIGKQPDYSEYFDKKEKREQEKIKNKSEERGVKIKRKTDEKWKPYIELVLNSDIDFSKFG